MYKTSEKNAEYSCWNRALAYELIFVILERDAAAPVAIRAWVSERIRLGLNAPNDAQLIEAENLAVKMELGRAFIRGITVGGGTPLFAQHRLAQDKEE